MFSIDSRKKGTISIPQILLMLYSLIFTGAQHNNRLNYIDSVESYSNLCPLGQNHKTEPSVEPGLVNFVSKSHEFYSQFIFPMFSIDSRKKGTISIPQILLMLYSLIFTGAQHNNRLNYIDSVESYSNLCPLGQNHKTEPSVEPGLVNFVSKSHEFCN
ncbi:hypothetical protein FBUS_05934 [Fasciolopsis buskii]|uniref:Uncharacterized protein n=1 Tax=Fasciolopsis buskii TaxID=27845 RepID=A0A8E0RVQ4_9TREM|nr:hypothetical protein FBUS_05934 [Fasciolopsis buski]